MKDNLLRERQRWFQFFPEGSIEFLLVTRVLALLLLLALMLMRLQRSAISVALVTVLWVDHAIMLWWLLQLAMDLAAISAQNVSDESVKPVQQHASRWRVAFLIMLPTILAAAILAPWPAMLHNVLTSSSDSLFGILITYRIPILAVAFVASILMAQRVVRKIQLEPFVWTVLMFIPGFHWLAIQRLSKHLRHRIVACQTLGVDKTIDKAAKATPLAMTIADATWVLMILPWAAVVVFVLATGRWPKEFPQVMMPSCGILVAAGFAVANIAALESVQRQFVDYLRRSQTHDQ